MNNVKEDINFQISIKATDGLLNQVKDVVVFQVRKQFQNQVWNRVYGQVYVQVREQVWQQIREDIK